MANELTKVEQFVLHVFTEMNTACKATQLIVECLNYFFKNPEAVKSLDISTEELTIDAIYSLVEKCQIIEIEYPDIVVPGRIKSFLLPKSSYGIAIKGTYWRDGGEGSIIFYV